MTNQDSNLLLTVPEDDLKKIESFSMSLLSMTNTYDLPESLVLLINDLVDEAETVRHRALFNYHVKDVVTTVNPHLPQ